MCDFAETYNIYDLEAYPVDYIATLAAGLRDNSRIMMKVTNMKVRPEILIMARIADNTALNVYAKTKDAQHGRNKPKSLVEALTAEIDVMKKPKEFENGDDFLKEWKRLSNG